MRKGNIGFVFQSFNLIDELNVFENVELPLTYLKVKASERKQMVNDILKRMNISHRANHFPQQLPEVSSSVSPLSVPLFRIRKSSLPMSRPVTWTPKTEPK